VGDPLVATVAVSFTALSAHVRTARFIAASVARRAGVAEDLLDEIRLAVSEACSLAVRLHLAHAPNAPVELRLIEADNHFRVQVRDAVFRQAPSEGEVVLDLTDHDFGAPPTASAQGGAAAAIGNGVTREGAAMALAPEDDSGALELRAHERIGLAVISGLVDDVQVDYLEGGSVVTMTWPIDDDNAAAARASGGNLL
jgi:anti-sigma regulatory factor (Ser/Thr protein kinase)